MPYLVTLSLVLLALARLLSSIGHHRQCVVDALCTGLPVWCMLSALACLCGACSLHWPTLPLKKKGSNFGMKGGG
jgi:hypothetical protein